MDLSRLDHINSMTKYPSIPTYHALGAKGILQEDGYTKFVGTVIGTEKVNGTNVRLIIFPDGDWIIGSREELLCARGDRVPNPTLGIVNTMKDVAERLAREWHAIPTVYYCEAYGKGIDGAKEYAKSATDYKLFDIAIFPYYEELLFWTRDRLASWREHEGQQYLDEEGFLNAATKRNLMMVPRLFTIAAEAMPVKIQDTRDFIQQAAPRTRVALDKEPGKAEGVVVRTTGETRQLAKIRFEDYDRTLRKMQVG